MPNPNDLSALDQEEAQLLARLSQIRAAKAKAQMKTGPVAPTPMSVGTGYAPREDPNNVRERALTPDEVTMRRRDAMAQAHERDASLNSLARPGSQPSAEEIRMILSSLGQRVR